MTPRFLTAILLFLSSYAPLGFILAAIDFDFGKHAFKHPLGAIICLATATVTGVLPSFILRNLTGGRVITISAINNRTGDLANYALPYLVTFVGLRLDDLSSLIGFGLFMALLCALAIRSQVLWVNPLLALYGYRLYEATVFSTDPAAPRTVMLMSPIELEPGRRCRIEYFTASQAYAIIPDLDRDAGATHAGEDDSTLSPDQEG